MPTSTCRSMLKAARRFFADRDTQMPGSGHDGVGMLRHSVGEDYPSESGCVRSRRSRA
jgi:hypothetical protein